MVVFVVAVAVVGVVVALRVVSAKAGLALAVGRRHGASRRGEVDAAGLADGAGLVLAATKREEAGLTLRTVAATMAGDACSAEAGQMEV